MMQAKKRRDGGRCVGLVGLALMISITTSLMITTPAVAQDAEKAKAIPEADQRAQGWNTLAAGLEAKIGRMLPCDPRVATSMNEVSRASELRMGASAKQWQAISGKLKEEAMAVEHTIALEQARGAEWTRDHADADQERTSVDAHVIALQRTLEKAPSLGDAEKQLTALAAETQKMAQRSEEREAAAGALNGELGELLRVKQAAQTNIDANLRALNSEAAAWEEYYAARAARAKTECAITNPVPEPEAPQRTVPKRTSPIRPGNKAPAAKGEN